MQAEQDREIQEGHTHEGKPGTHEVTVTVSEPIKLTPGRHTVASIKDEAHIPLADELALVEHGHLHPLPDDGTVEIKGGEEFIAYPKDSGSSHDDACQGDR